MKVALSEVALLVQGVVIGELSTTISGLSTIDNIIPDSLVFVDNDVSLKLAEQSDVAVILGSLDIKSSSKPLILVEHPFKAFVQLLDYYYSNPKPIPGIHPTAIIAPDVVLGHNVTIGPYVIIGTGCKIGAACVLKGHVYLGNNVILGHETILHPQVTVYDNCQLGARVIIHASSVIGSDGFGYKFIENQHVKFPHYGCVRIEDDVEIGANTVIDRATMGETVIGAGTKIDNLVQIAHSVKLGKNNILCALTGVAGSTTSGDRVIFAANVGVSDHVQIDDDVVLGARTGVPPKKHLRKGVIYLGNPARPKDKAIEQELSTTRIPGMRNTLKSLLEKVAVLQNRLTKLEENLTAHS